MTDPKMLPNGTAPRKHLDSDALDSNATFVAAERSILDRLILCLVTEKLVDLAACSSHGVHLDPAAGRHGISASPILVDGQREVTKPLDLLDVLSQRHLVPQGKAQSWDQVRLEIADSVRGLALARAAEKARAHRLQTLIQANSHCRRPFSTLVAALQADHYAKHALVGFEQCVVDGHPLTPCAKIKLGMSAADASRYGPEFGASFGLRFVAVKRGWTEGESGAIATATAKTILPQTHGAADSFEAVLRSAFPLAINCAHAQLAAMGIDPGRYVLIPVHPLQLDHALPKLHAAELANKTLIPLDVTIPAKPLMSVRTLSVREGSTGLHVKTALEVQLTGCIRGVSTTSVHNGPRMSRLIASIVAGDIDLARTDMSGRSLFATARELAGMAFTGSKRALGSLLREDPEDTMGPDEVGMPVAALLARSPLSNRTIIGDLLQEAISGASPSISPQHVAEDWLRAHVSLFVPPLLTLLSRYGVALEPHPQNAVIVIKNGRPHRAYVRDFGGARVLPYRLARRGYAIELGGDTGLIAVDAVSLRAKLFYPLFGNHLGQVVASMAAAAACDEMPLWAIVRECVHDTLAYLTRSSASKQEQDETVDDGYALLYEPWRRKTLLAMRLEGLVTDQRYVDAGNPLSAVEVPPVPLPSFRLNTVEQRMFDHLCVKEPALATQWLEELDGARSDVQRDQEEALFREGVLPNAGVINGHAADWNLAARELEDSACNLALGRAVGRWRGERLRLRALALNTATTLATLSKERSSSDIPIDLDVLCVEGHPLHPCRRTRTGFSPDDSLAYAPECDPMVGVPLVAVLRALTLSTPGTSGLSVGQVLAQHYPVIVRSAEQALMRRGLDPTLYEFVPAHPWQAANVIPHEYAREIADGAIVILSEVQLSCRPTVSTRTVVTSTAGVLGRRLALKTAMDVQLTSTRRTISHASTRNGPRLSTVLDSLLSTEQLTDGCVTCVPELAGIAFVPPEGNQSSAARERGLSAVIRADPADYIELGELAISCSSLIATSPITGKSILAEVVGAMVDPSSDLRMAAASFMAQYAQLLLSATLPLLWRTGIALEAHLQNTLLAVRPGAKGHPMRLSRILLRDFAGLRIHLGRLCASNHDFTPHPGSIIVTNDIDVLRGKFTHAVIFGNLLAVVHELSTATSATKSELWAIVRGCILALGARFSAAWPNLAAQAQGDIAALLGPTLRQKALLTMRVTPSAGDCYTEQPNPLYMPESQGFSVNGRIDGCPNGAGRGAAHV